jgi:hypothetical protein
LKPTKPKSFSKVINIKNQRLFSVMDIETVEFKNKEIPACISIKTNNNLKIFIIESDLFIRDHNLAIIDVDIAIKEL